MNLPNSLTVGRIFLVPLLVSVLLTKFEGRQVLGLPVELVAAGIFGLASLTDWLDGYLARRRQQVTWLGQILDPLADKLLLVTAYVMLAIPNLRAGGLVIPAWVTALVITRDVVIVVVALVLHLAVGISRFPPSPLSKINTAAQLLAIIGVLLSGRGTLFEASASFLVFLVAALTIGSGIEYIYRANRMAADRE